jgi:hypothetical protein
MTGFLLPAQYADIDSSSFGYPSPYFTTYNDLPMKRTEPLIMRTSTNAMTLFFDIVIVFIVLIIIVKIISKIISAKNKGVLIPKNPNRME